MNTFNINDSSLSLVVRKNYSILILHRWIGLESQGYLIWTLENLAQIIRAMRLILKWMRVSKHQKRHYRNATNSIQWEYYQR